MHSNHAVPKLGVIAPDRKRRVRKQSGMAVKARAGLSQLFKADSKRARSDIKKLRLPRGDSKALTVSFCHSKQAI